MKLCDVHTHALPGVDDGAPTMEYALQMLQNAAAGDVELLAVTPHCNVQGTDGWESLADLDRRFRQLQQAAEDIPVKLVLGGEVRANGQLSQRLEQGLLPTINGSRYLLTEFVPSTKKTDFSEILQSILDRGYVPLIAHPERYNAVCEDPRIVMQWLDMGCHLQLTGDSIMGRHGKAVQLTSQILLRNDLVACVASDAHGLHRRSNFLQDVCDHLSVVYSRHYAKCLMYTNPMRICNNEGL